MSRRWQYVADPESQVFGMIALGITVAIWLLAWPWGLIFGPWVWWVATGLSAVPAFFAIMLLVFPLFDNDNWKSNPKCRRCNHHKSEHEGTGYCTMMLEDAKEGYRPCGCQGFE